MTFRQEPLGLKRPNLVHTVARNNAVGQRCELCLPCCNHDPETVILAHLRMFGIAGISQKPDDWCAVFACSACHDALDRRNAMTAGLWGYEDIARALIWTLKTQFADRVFIPGPGK